MKCSCDRFVLIAFELFILEIEFDFLPMSELKNWMLLYVISQNTSLRSANDKFEIPISKSQYVACDIRVLILEFGAWNLEFEIVDCILEYE